MSPTGRRQSKIYVTQLSKKPNTGLMDYITHSNHPTLNKRGMMSRTISGSENDYEKVEKEKKKQELLDNLQGMNMQLKTLVEKVIDQEKVKRKQTQIIL